MKLKVFLKIVLFLFVTNSLSAANYFWAGGVGNWSQITNWVTTNGGSILHTALPDSMDNVYITMGDTVLITGDTAWCNDLSVTNGVLEQSGGFLIFYGDLINNGVVKQTGGKFVIGGWGYDIIGGGNTLFLDSIELYKNGYCDITRRTVIAKNMDFKRGYAFTDVTQDLRFLSGATCNGGNDTSYAIGPISKYGGEAFTFPIGFGDKWARLAISDAQNPLDTAFFSAEYLKLLPIDTGSYLMPIKKVSEIEYWNLNKISGTGSYKVKLHYEHSGVSGIQIPDSLLVVKYDGTNWISNGNDTSSPFGGRGFVESEYITTFSPFTFGTVFFSSNSLPVDLLTFDAVKVGKEALLNWTTTQEIDNSHFNILRSTDNINFTKVGHVKAAIGASSATLNYSYADNKIEQLESKMVYYKLQQVDMNGTITESKTRFIKINKCKDLIVTPNPSQGIISVDTHKKPGLIEVYNMLGELVYKQKVISVEHAAKLDLTTLKEGTHLIKFNSENDVQFVRVILQ